MTATSQQSAPGLRNGSEQSLVEPLLRELERIAGRADSERAAADQALIAELRQEITELRAAVAHLRAGSAPLPGRLRRVVARAMTTVDTTAADGRAGPA